MDLKRVKLGTSKKKYRPASVARVAETKWGSDDEVEAHDRASRAGLIETEIVPLQPISTRWWRRFVDSFVSNRRKLMSNELVGQDTIVELRSKLTETERERDEARAELELADTQQRNSFSEILRLRAALTPQKESDD